MDMRSLSDDYYALDEKNHCLVGRRKGKVYRLTAKIKVKVIEANGLNGSTIFEPVDSDKGADIPWLKDSKIPGVKPKRNYSKKRSGKNNNKRRRKR